MAADRALVNRMADLHRKLGEYSDTGFALAIHIRYTRPGLLYRTYRQDWIDHYSERGFMLFDPVVRWGVMNVGGMDWDALKGDDPEGVIAAAAEHGLINGWTYATGPANSRTISGHTRSTAPYSESDKATLKAIVDEIHALTEGIESFDEGTMEALRGMT